MSHVVEVGVGLIGGGVGLMVLSIGIGHEFALIGAALFTFGFLSFIFFGDGDDNDE